MKTLLCRENHISVQENTEDLRRVPLCVLVGPRLKALETVGATLAEILPRKFIYSPGQTHFFEERLCKLYRAVRRARVTENNAVDPRAYGGKEATKIPFLVFHHRKKDDFHGGHSVCVPGFIGLEKFAPAPRTYQTSSPP